MPYPFERLIVDVPDFPLPGIVFKDITPVLDDPTSFRQVIDAFAEEWTDHGITRVVAIESRGFIFGSALAYVMGVGLTLVRKPGKLPRKTVKIEDALEYGTDTREIHRDALSPSERVVIIDDVLATGGTAAATLGLVQSTGAEIAGLGFLIELGFLGGRNKLGDTSIKSLVLVEG